MNYRTMLMAVAFALVLTACGQPAAQTPTASPAATVAPIATTTAAQATPSAPSPAPAGVLPIPLLFVDEGSQIVRLDVDGKTRTTLAREPVMIIAFARSPDGATIAYITIDESQNSTLVRIGADGANRAELARGFIRSLAVARDGSVQAGMLFDSVAADGQALQDGAWSFPADGGTPTLLAASTEPSEQTGPGTHYQPSLWSADGTQLLLMLTMNDGPDGPAGDIGTIGWALYSTSSGQVRELLPMGQEPLCISPAWSQAGDAIYCANAGAIPAPTPGLWRLSLGDGAQQTLIE
ncbi:MAG: hypothetical protein HGB28_04315, partial [Oscillochloris sp.]|nr:hypothetical protein [Oscillochloris sp.]